MGTIAVLGMVGIAVWFAVRSMLRRKRHGKSLSCGGNCQNCSGGCQKDIRKE